jgi:AcrR family transcriptional regulator
MIDGRTKAKDERGDRVLETAARLLRERGPRDTTLNGIADAAGVARRTLYNHFPSKDALFSALAAPVAARLEARLESFSPGRADPLGDLAAFLWETWEESGQDIELLADRSLSEYPSLAESHRIFAAKFAKLFASKGVARALRFGPELAAALAYRCMPGICRTLAGARRANEEFASIIKGMIGRE